MTGLGQRDDGGPYVGWGKGRAWPLLTGERAHYELAAGRDIGHLIRAMEGFAGTAGLLPEPFGRCGHWLPGVVILDHLYWSHRCLGFAVVYGSRVARPPQIELACQGL